MKPSICFCRGAFTEFVVHVDSMYFTVDYWHRIEMGYDDVSEEHIASIFVPEGGGNIFLRNV
jgi:hypothetical protein